MLDDDDHDGLRCLPLQRETTSSSCLVAWRLHRLRRVHGIQTPTIYAFIYRKIARILTLRTAFSWIETEHQTP